MNRSDAILVDTDVFSLRYVLPPAADPRIPTWREILYTRRVVISFPTRAEVLAGANSAKWGQRRISKAVELLQNTPTVHSDDEVVAAYATLTAECRRLGHALHDRVHTSDRWDAACAIAKRLDLLAGDSIYRGAPNLKGTRG